MIFVVNMLYSKFLCLFLREIYILHICPLRNEDDIVVMLRALLCYLPIVLCEFFRKVVFCCEVFEGNIFALI